MKKCYPYPLITAFLLILFFSFNLHAQNMERKDIDNKYKWDLSILYPSVDAWKADYNSISKKLNDIAKFKGKLGNDAETFYNGLKLYFDLLKDFYELAEYSNRLSDQDLRDSENQSLVQQTNSLGTKFSEASSYIEPEILRIDPEKVENFFGKKKELSEFKFFVDDIQRRRAHTLSENEEQILASAGMVTGTPSDVYNIFDNAEKPNAEVKLSDGKEVTLSSAGYVKYRAVPNRNDRKKVFESVFENYGIFENTIGANLAGKVKADYFYAKNRKYNSALEYSLNANNIPVSVYENLINQINHNLPTLQRFLNLKRRMLGLDTLHYYDLYTPIVKEVEMNFTVEKGEDIILNALKPMGKEYLSTIKKAFSNRWIDFYPNTGKRSGAYSTGAAYDYHPYILMNWTDDYESVSTLAHELGHTMHSYYTNNNQPFVNSNYATFVAEIASTINETLLNNFMVENVKSDEEKLYLLGTYLELLRTTIFRQTSFAEFELAIHQRVENNEPLTGEIMSKIYYDIVKKYYGNDKGVCVVDPYISHEWEYIPHFINYTYYVYQYSTSLIYATAFAQKIVDEGQPAVDKFYNILKGGSSDYPINLIKSAGIDPLSSEAFDLTMKKMNDVMDQIEVILDKK